MKMKMKNAIRIGVEINLVSFHDYQKKKVLIFKKTCNATPTQYEIYDSWNSLELKEEKYFGRLRWGYFSVSKEPLGKPIYEFSFGDKYKGCFKDETEELSHLKKVCEKIWKHK